MLPAILRAMLIMFNFPAILLAIFSYFELEIDDNLAKKANKMLKTCVNLHYRLINFVQLQPYQAVTSRLE